MEYFVVWIWLVAVVGVVADDSHADVVVVVVVLASDAASIVRNLALVAMMHEHSSLNQNLG
jgi:parvulin-like peptidyl-prolyl isomerase